MTRDAKTKTLIRLVGVVVLMGGLAWASVPFYDWFCRVTGFGGVTGVAEAGSETVLDETIKVRFDASKARGMPWELRAGRARDGDPHRRDGAGLLRGAQPHRPPVAGRANYNVTPYEAGGFFTKIDCFCFESRCCSRASGCRCR